MDEAARKRKYEELVAFTKKQIELTSDPDARARLEQALRDAELVETESTRLRAEMRKAEDKMEEIVHRAASFVRVMPWMIGIGTAFLIGVFLVKRYL